MEEEAEKMAALKKAYADIILNTAKESAARVLAAERKALGFQQSLFAAKEEALATMPRLKAIMEDKLKLHAPGLGWIGQEADTVEIKTNVGSVRACRGRRGTSAGYLREAARTKAEKKPEAEVDASGGEWLMEALRRIEVCWSLRKEVEAFAGLRLVQCLACRWIETDEQLIFSCLGEN